MKILLVSNCPLLYHQGSGYVIINLVSGLRSLGHEIEAYGPEDYEPFSSVSKAKTYKVAIGMLFLTIRKLMRAKYDLIVFYGAEAWLTLFVFKRLFKTRTTMVCNSNGLETRYMDAMMRMFGTISFNLQPTKWHTTDPRNFYHKAFKWCDGIVTTNELDRAYGIEKKYKPEEKIICAEIGLQEEFLNIRSDFADSKTIGFCGSWIKRKGIEFFVPALERILSEYPEYQVILIGVGEAFNKTEIFSSKIISRVHVYPQIVDRTQLIETYKRMSIFVLPSMYESFGLVFAEAMACGCALVASDTGFASSLSSEEAIILEQLNEDKIYQAIKLLADDENLRKKLARNGNRRVQDLKWDRSIRKIESAYLDWIKNS